MGCGLFEIVTTGFALTVPLGEREVPAGSLVERTGDCPGGAVVVVRQTPSAWFLPYVVGAEGCVPEEALGPPPAHVLVQRGAREGAVLALEETGACGAWLLDGAPYEALGKVQPLSETERAGIEAVQKAYEQHFEPIGLASIEWTEWGFVGLPLVPLTRSEIDREAAAEGLDTPEREEKVWRAVGPSRGGVVYAHFEGADAPRSDRWARPETVVAFLGLASGWWDHCTKVLAGDPAMAANSRTCTLQVGDLAWYNGVRPDPLGHVDHWQGTCVDLRLFRTDGSHYEAWWNRPDDRPGRTGGYNRPLTRAFLEWALANAPVSAAYYGDPAIDVPGVEPLPGHDDHLHLCFE